MYFNFSYFQNLIYCICNLRFLHLLQFKECAFRNENLRIKLSPKVANNLIIEVLNKSVFNKAKFV